jgi:tetratricopeptide (TPR) repeat protein
VILERGQTIDRFVVLGLVGRGGMGEVYAAYDPELDRKVAIKLLRARGDTGEGRTRLLREAQAIAKLQHPNVVVVYDVGTFGDSVFIAMEFVEGRTAGGWLHAETRTRREILQVYLAAGRGLVAAHAAGLVHRDFKPDNVMVTNDGQVRVMDFGLARQIGDDEPPSRAQGAAAAAAGSGDADVSGYDPEATADLGPAGVRDVAPTSGKYLSLKLTQTGAMLGTPAYMAPEQFAVQATDARTDQFSFCVALYEALYGKRPFEGDSFLALMTNVTTGAVTEAPAKAKVPGWMRRVVVRGLATDPDQRFSSMTALLTALETDPTVRLRRIATAFLVLSSLGGAAVAAHRATSSKVTLCQGGQARLAGIWEPDGARSARKDTIHRAFAATGKSYAQQAFAGVTRMLDEYSAKWTRMYADACEATNVRGEQSSEVLDLRMGCLQDRLAGVRALSDVFASADGKVVENAVTAAGSLPLVDRCADVTLLKAVIKPPQDEPTLRLVDTVRAERAKLSAFRASGRCLEAVKASDALIARARATGYFPILAEVLNTAAVVNSDCGDPVVTVRQYHEAYSVALQAHHDEAATEAATVLSGMLPDRRGDIAGGREWLGIARAMIGRIGGHQLFELWVLQNEATILTMEGHAAEGAELAERVRAGKEKLHGKDHPDTLQSAQGRALALDVAGRHEEALLVEASVVEGFSRVLGPEHPSVAMASSNEGEFLNALHRHAEAKAKFQRAIAIWRQSGVDPYFLSFGLTGLGIAELGLRNATAAVRALEAALPIRMAAPDDHERLGETRFALARAIGKRPSGRARARALALLARADFSTLDKPSAKEVVAEIDAWLRDSARGQ